MFYISLVCLFFFLFLFLHGMAPDDQSMGIMDWSDTDSVGVLGINGFRGTSCHSVCCLLLNSGRSVSEFHGSLFRVFLTLDSKRFFIALPRYTLDFHSQVICFIL